MSDILFKMAAKTNVGLERQNNEDNFQVSANLDILPMQWVNNQQYNLGNRGALLVVADGMGGMNAGEVASQIAIDTVRSSFTPEKITDEVVKSRFTIEKFMKDVIVAADQNIRNYAKAYPESRGMGTTIVMAWLFDGMLYVSWVGDSRAYIYNPNTGLFQVSKDHSYVQELVDAGKISEEDAFDYPDSNIITRSLSDAAPKAQPDCLFTPQKLCNGDIILLCSDGLSGMIRDGEIEQIIAQHQADMTVCVDTLIQAALDAGGADNCTVAICQILSGGAQSEPARVPKKARPAAVPLASGDTRPQNSGTDSTARDAKNTGREAMNAGSEAKKGGNTFVRYVLPIMLFAIVACAAVLFVMKPWEKPEVNTGEQEKAEKEQLAEETPLVDERKDSLVFSDFTAKLDNADKIAFTVTIMNEGDSVEVDDYQITLRLDNKELRAATFGYVPLPAGKKTKVKGSIEQPKNEGTYTYVAMIKNKNNEDLGPMTADVVISTKKQDPKAQQQATSTKTPPTTDSGLITLQEYKKNKEGFTKVTTQFFKWEKGNTFSGFLKSVSGQIQNDVELLKELNKNNVDLKDKLKIEKLPAADFTAKDSNQFPIIYVVRKK